MALESPTATNADAIAAYYDDEMQKPLRDFVYGNARVQAAIDLCLAYIHPHSRNLLDVGCGFGQSSAEFRQNRPWVDVTSVDISPKRIECGRRLFADYDIRFQVSDMTTVPEGGPFDVITMLDVYEHIPKYARPQFHRTLAEALGRDGTVILTVPSPLHQGHLSANRPEGLQVVDETIQLNDVIRLANDLGGEVVLFHYVSIWHTNDYVHAAVTRQPRYDMIDVEERASLGSGGLKRISRSVSRVLGTLGGATNWPVNAWWPGN